MPFLCSRRGPGTAQGFQAAPQGTFVQNRNAGDWQPLACTREAQAWTPKQTGLWNPLGVLAPLPRWRVEEEERAFPAEGMAESPKSAGSLPRPPPPVLPRSLSFCNTCTSSWASEKKRRCLLKSSDCQKTGGEGACRCGLIDLGPVPGWKVEGATGRVTLGALSWEGRSEIRGSRGLPSGAEFASAAKEGGRWR